MTKLPLVNISKKETEKFFLIIIKIKHSVEEIKMLGPFQFVTSSL
jgi:hypothetical protein